MARDEGRATGGSAGWRTQTRCVPCARGRERQQGVRAAAAAAADLHVQALSVHILQLPGARETHPQVSSRREPAGDAAADDRATVKRAPERQAHSADKMSRHYEETIN